MFLSLCPVLLSDVLDYGLHHLLPAVRLHRVDVLHDLCGECKAAVDHPRSLYPVDRKQFFLNWQRAAAL